MSLHETITEIEHNLEQIGNVFKDRYQMIDGLHRFELRMNDDDSWCVLFASGRVFIPSDEIDEIQRQVSNALENVIRRLT
jgi:hypothetical protein